MIKELNIFEYLKDLEELRTPLSDFYITTKECEIWGAYTENKCVGFLLCERRAVCEILVLCANGDDEKVKNELLDEFLASLPHQTAVRWRITENQTIQNDHRQLAERRGFNKESVLHVFHGDASVAPALAVLNARYTPVCARMEKYGYTTKPFAELTNDELHQIVDNPDGEFENYLQSGENVAGINGKLDKQCSFATVQGGKVFAYTIVVAPDEKKCIIENTAVARSAKKGGTYVLPFLATMNAMGRSNYQAYSFAIYETNSDALPLIKKHFSSLFTSEILQQNYFFIKQ